MSSSSRCRSRRGKGSRSRERSPPSDSSLPSSSLCESGVDSSPLKHDQDQLRCDLREATLSIAQLTRDRAADKDKYLDVCTQLALANARCDHQQHTIGALHSRNQQLLARLSGLGQPVELEVENLSTVAHRQDSIVGGAFAFDFSRVDCGEHVVNDDFHGMGSGLGNRCDFHAIATPHISSFGFGDGCDGISDSNNVCVSSFCINRDNRVCFTAGLNGCVFV